MNKNVRGLVIISVNLLILVAIGVLWMQSIREQRIQKSQTLEIKVHTNAQEELLETKDILMWFREFYKKDIRKIPSYNLNLKKLEEHILSKPLVRRADIYLDAKSVLHADVYQRIPLMRIIDVTGDQYYIDEDGYKIPVSAKYSSRVIVATGQLARIEGRMMKPRERMYYSGIMNVVKEIQQDSFVRSLIEQIDMDDNGEYTLIPKVGSEKILLGGSEMIDDKLDRLKLFYRENMGRQGWNVYQLVNLKFKGQIIGKKIQQES